MGPGIPRPITIFIDRADAEPLLSVALLNLASPFVDRAEQEATLSLVCQLRTALRGAAALPAAVGPTQRTLSLSSEHTMA